jgi:steroid delta-isomerase-like uncharacterized protein
MAPNIENLKKAHQSFNRREIDGTLSVMAENIVYHDRSRGIDFKGRDEFKAFMSQWLKSFSDCKVENPTYLEAGDKVIAQFTVRGTNDGPFGQVAPTGKKMSISICEIMQFNKQGQVISGDLYYDQLSMLVQLGLAQPRPTVGAEAAAPTQH